MKRIKRFLQNIKFSLQGLGSNKLTSGLTLLGIVIGIGSVIGMMGLGQGAQDSIVGELESLGTDVIIITAGADLYGGQERMSEMSSEDKDFNSQISQSVSGIVDIEPLTLEDYEFLKEEKIENVKNVSFIISEALNISFEEYEDEGYTVVGVDGSYNDLYELEFDEGDFFSSEDIEDGNKVVILGANVLEYDEREIGSIIEINDEEFEVIGILSEQEDSLLGSSPNTEIYTPYLTIASMGVDTEALTNIIVKVSDDSILEDTIEAINSKLSEFRNVEEPDFSILSIQTLISTVTQITDTFTVLLSAIAGISLLVGGIGISNVMLITVTQRTREIGVRKAIGARRGDILLQFLAEAVFLTLIGGILGLGLGYLIGLVGQQALGLGAVITLDSVLMAVGISVGIGIVFGILPANKASKLSPIDALRYE